MDEITERYQRSSAAERERLLRSSVSLIKRRSFPLSIEECVAYGLTLFLGIVVGWAFGAAL